MPAAAPEAVNWFRRFRLRFAAMVGRLERLQRSLRMFSQHTAGYLLLVYSATVAWMALWAAYDLVVVGSAFPPVPGYAPNTGLYWTATWWVLFPITTILAFRRHAWLPILALIGGWEDILFYWIKGVRVPPLLMGSTDAMLYLRAVLTLVASVVAVVLVRHRSVRIH